MAKKANGEGSINKYKDGWRATITLGRDDDGKLIRKQFYGKTKLEAKAKMDDYRAKHNAGLLPTDESITLQQWFYTWLFEYKINDVRHTTLEKYEGVYRNYIKNSSIGLMKLKDLKSANIQAYYNRLIKNENKSPDTVRTINKVLKSALNQAKKESYILNNGCDNVILPKTASKKDVEIFTLEEQQHFIKSIENHKHKNLFILVLATGLRISEVIALKWSDINFETGELTVQRNFQRVTKLEKLEGNNYEGFKTELIEQEPKTKYSIRTIPIPSSVLKELKAHNKRQKENIMKHREAYAYNDLVFPNSLGEPMDIRNLSKIYENVLKDAGITHKKFHALRHTYATRLFENNVPLKTVQILMGHSNIKITADIYTHVMPSEKINAVEKINNLFVL